MSSVDPSIEPASLGAADARRRAMRFGAIALAIGIMGISFSPIFVKESEVGPTATAFYRMGFALPALTAWVLLESRGRVQERPVTRRDWWLLVLCGLLFTADLICWHASIRLTNVANATFLGNLGTLVVTLGAWLVLRERITAGFAGGMALALGGVGLMMGASAIGHTGGLLGDGMGVLTAVFYGGYLLVVKIARNRGLASGLIMLTSGVISTAGFIIAAVALGEQIIPDTMYGWAMLICIALVTQALGQGFVTVSMRHLPGTVVAVSLLMNPVLSAVFAWAMLGERLSTLQAIGCAIVLAGIAIAQLLNRPGQRP